MFRLVFTLIGASVAVLGLAACGDRVSLPPAQDDATVSERERQAFVEASRPDGTSRPVVALLALNEGTEMTDLMLPHAVLKRADVADVQIVAPRRGRVILYPALQVEGAQDLASFDQAHPSGADYVIVPAMSDDDDPAVTGWLRRQAERGAKVIAVCAGGVVVGQARLLNGRRFAAHWYYRDKLIDRHPSATYVPHERYLIDRGVATTTGITASVPTMLALVEAIGGHEKAQSLATELGVTSWTPVHDSTPFHLDAARMWTYVLNKITFWRNEHWSVDVRDGMDDIALALATDAWSRSGRVTVEAAAAGPVTLRSGLVLVAQSADDDTPRLPLSPSLTPVQQLDRTLCEIDERFGASRRDIAMLEMEYPSATVDCAR
jgi:putative intracellular protease/amidase